MYDYFVFGMSFLFFLLIAVFNFWLFLTRYHFHLIEFNAVCFFLLLLFFFNYGSENKGGPRQIFIQTPISLFILSFLMTKQSKKIRQIDADLEVASLNKVLSKKVVILLEKLHFQ
jgi:hypothetical protein